MLLWGQKVHHLTRYFFFLGIVAFGLYWTRIHDEIAFLVTGPPIFLSFWLKRFLDDSITLPDSPGVIHFLFLMPITIAYFSLMGFLLKNIWNEKGLVRIVTLLALAGFLVYIHYQAQKYLTGYFELPGP